MYIHRALMCFGGIRNAIYERMQFFILLSVKVASRWPLQSPVAGLLISDQIILWQ